MLHKEMMTQKHLRIFKTFNMYISCAASGMCFAVTGPTLIELQHIVNTNTRNIAYIYTARSSGFLFGSLIGGVIFDLTAKKQIGLMILTVLMSGSLFAIPWSTSIGMLIAWMFLNGSSLGALHTGMNAWCLHLWGKDSGPFFQAFHFTYGLGSLIAPLLAAPFQGNHHHVSTTHNNASATNQSLVHNFNETIQSLDSSVIPRVAYVYAIITVCGLLSTVLFLVTCILAPFDDILESKETYEARKNRRVFTITVVFLGFLILLVTAGNEIGYAQLLTTNAVHGPLKISETVGDYMTSAFWASFTLSRFWTIFLAIKLSNLVLIVSNLVVTMVGSAVLFFLGGKVEWGLWLASVILGIGIGPLFPTTVAWVDQCIPVTNKIVSIFTIGAAFGEMIVPYIISHYLEEVPFIMNYVVTACCSFSVVLSFILFLVLKNKNCKNVSEKGNPT